jgi:hypothetical protein
MTGNERTRALRPGGTSWRGARPGSPRSPQSGLRVFPHQLSDGPGPRRPADRRACASSGRSVQRSSTTSVGRIGAGASDDLRPRSMRRVGRGVRRSSTTSVRRIGPARRTDRRPSSVRLIGRERPTIVDHARAPHRAAAAGHVARAARGCARGAWRRPRSVAIAAVVAAAILVGPRCGAPPRARLRWSDPTDAGRSAHRRH